MNHASTARRVEPGTVLVLAIAAALIAVALSMRIAIAWMDIETIARKVLPDDAFYYFETADRIGRGQNVSFDGINLSNGYHPFWLFTLVPVWLLPGDDLPLHVALTLSSIFDVAAAAITSLTVWRLTSKPGAALFALFVYLFLPQNVFAAVNGVESAMAALFLSLLLLLTVEWRNGALTGERAALVGAAGGLMILSRLDTATVFVAALALLAWHRRAAEWRPLALSAAVAAVMVAPWFIWSVAATGELQPVSALSPTYMFKAHYDSAHPDAGAIEHARQGLRVARTAFDEAIPFLYFPGQRWSVAFLALLASLGAHFALFARGEHRRRVAAQLVLAGLPLGACALTLLVNTVYRWNPREWYYAWTMPCVVLAFGVAFAYLDDVVRGAMDRWSSIRAAPELARSLAVMAAVVALLIAAYADKGRDRWRDGIYPFRQDGIDAAAWIDANTQPDDRIASFNAGTIAYFTDRPVINIDGVVNQGAYEALRDRRLLAYLREQDVKYLIDFYGGWTFAFGPVDGDWSKSLWGEDANAGLREVAVIGAPNAFGRMMVFEVAPE